MAVKFEIFWVLEQSNEEYDLLIRPSGRSQGMCMDSMAGRLDVLVPYNTNTPAIEDLAPKISICIRSRHQSSEAALNLSLLELLQTLDEKLALECIGVRKNRLSQGMTSTTALKTEVSAPRLPKLQQDLKLEA